ncbi:MAG: type II toxin-antitoxin system HicA family toxin [Lachnospiraceae bacterium]|nr:type II toxin-antitoxin system HicA family toxin [Lachnospiraceae bacterium]
MTVREIEAELKKDGWHFIKQIGSHRQYKHPSKKGKVTVPYHKGDLDIGTAKSIFKQAGIEF